MGSPKDTKLVDFVFARTPQESVGPRRTRHRHGSDREAEGSNPSSPNSFEFGFVLFILNSPRIRGASRFSAMRRLISATLQRLCM